MTGRWLGLLAAACLASPALAAEGVTLAGVAWSSSGAEGDRLVLKLQPASATVDLMVLPWGVEVWIPGARAAAGDLPGEVVLQADPAGARLRVERPGATVRGLRHVAGQVEVLLSGGTARDGGYRIGVGDVISLSVYKNPDLSGDLTVGPDGSVTLPLVGPVPAAGRTDGQLAEDVRAILASDYLVDPQVSVTIKTYQSQFVHVAGSVPRAARVAVRPGMTLKDVLSEAGVALAPGQEVVLTRQNGKPLHLTAAQLERGDAVPRDGDVLTVQERGYVVINGEVRRPGRQTLTPGMTLLEAIAVVEGLTDWANKKDVRILRREEATGAQREVVVNLRDVESGRVPDPLLQAGDVVLVRRRFL